MAKTAKTPAAGKTAAGRNKNTGKGSAGSGRAAKPAKRTSKKKTGFCAWLKSLFLRKKKSDVGKIYWTDDGYFSQTEKRTKPRPIAVIDQRKKDGALAITKIYSKEGKSGNGYVDNLTLSPKDHQALTEDSLVGRQVIIGTRKNKAKTREEKNYKPIFARDLEETDDRLTSEEYQKITNSINDTPEHRKSYRKKMKKWHNGFKEK